MLLFLEEAVDLGLPNVGRRFGWVVKVADLVALREALVDFAAQVEALVVVPRTPSQMEQDCVASYLSKHL